MSIALLNKEVKVTWSARVSAKELIYSAKKKLDVSHVGEPHEY